MPFDSVVVTNVTRGWTETLVYPDTTLVLSRLGVGEIAPDQAGITSIFPNPFDAFANVGFGLAEAGRVGIRVVGIDGVMKVSWEGYLSSGIHQVRIGLSRPQMALVIIDTEKDRYVGKLLQIGYGGSDAIELNDEPGDKPECAGRAVRSDRLESYGGFEPGDYMSFMGVCTSPDGEVVVSRMITRAIFGDETIALEFRMELAFGSIQGIVTNAITNEPLQGVDIMLSPSGLSAVTGSDGRYVFMNISSGQYKVYFRKSGFKTDTKTVYVIGSEVTSGDKMLMPELAEFRLSEDCLDFGDTFSELCFRIINQNEDLSVSWEIMESMDWMTITPDSGTLLGGQEAIVCVHIDRGQILQNTTANIVIGNSDMTIVLPVNVSVSGSSGPQLQLSETSLDFGTSATSLAFYVMNTGPVGTSLNWICSNITVDWLELMPTSGNTDGGSSTPVMVIIDRSKFNGLVSTSVIVYGAGESAVLSISAMEYNPSPDVPEGALNGLFTVSEGQQVFFSQGNLQYQASTNTWRFAEHQWDFVGDDTRGSVYENGIKCNNALISSTYSGWIDMFGWGTSGYNHGANCYQPWSISEEYDDYYAYGSSTSHLYEQSGQADWGYNAISNGGNQENLWRSLSNDEWDYLLNIRTTLSGIRFAKAYLNDVAGLVILPDNWNESVYEFNSTNNAWEAYSSNTITLTDWESLLQPAGVVFLPAAGSRRGTVVSERVEWGQYWTASCLTEWMAYPVSFDEVHLDPPFGYDNRFNGQTVRLARTATCITSYYIEATPNPFEGGTIIGSGRYLQGTTCYLTARAAYGYSFVNWTEDGEEVSTETTYSFTVEDNRTLEANFVYTGGGDVPMGAINGLFTVSEGQQVFFSQGNLQYQASTNTWRFAENQWNYVGDYWYGNVYENGEKCDNAFISSTYSGWIDLFGWGTSGFNHGANCYQPWSTSTSSSDYYVYGNYQYNLYDLTGKADWGCNPISNGGNVEDYAWRTMTQLEWDYVFNGRNTVSGIRYAKAEVNNVYGVVLLPDDWNSSYFMLNNINNNSADYSSNTISIEQWSTLEQHNAVFLPAAGDRNETLVVGAGSYGVYWSATHVDDIFSSAVYFYDSHLSTNLDNHLRYVARSVRLVCPVGGGVIPTPPNPGSEVQSMPYTQSFATEFGTYATYNVMGPQSWMIDYSSAKMSGYENGVYYVNEDWLISSPVAVTDVNHAKVSVTYVARYQNDDAYDITLQVSSDYVYGADPSTATWTQMSSYYPNTSSWSDFKTVETNLDDFIGQNITVAIKYTSTDSQSRTMEIKRITIEEDSEVKNVVVE